MRSRGVIVLALLLYGAVLAVVLWPRASAARSDDTTGQSTSAPTSQSTSSTAGLPYRGITMQIQRVDWIDKYEKCIDEIAALGADTVKLVVDTRQENGHSGRIYLDMRMTPTPDRLMELIGHAKKKGLRVILMPIVLLDAPEGNEWRGTISPPSWFGWFESYRSMISQFAWISELSKVDVLVVGSELVSSEPHVDEWTKTIQEVRKNFHGQLTYSSNWDHYRSIGFWDQLDLIGMNSYWKLGEDKDVSVDEIKLKWKQIQSDLIPFVVSKGKPLVFLEVGWCSLENAASAPWDYTQEEVPIDLDLQKRLYEAFFESWEGNPHLGGYNIWEWPPGEGGPDDRGYTPKGKPAEAVLKKWLAKPRWKVVP